MPAFNYILNVTGDCNNNSSGALQVGFSGGTPPYTVTWLNPLGGGNIIDYLVYDYNYVDPYSPNLTYSLITGLSAKTYVFTVNDSTLPNNLEYSVNAPVSSGNCASVLEIQTNTCGLNNGTVTVTSSSDYSETYFYLYDFDGTYLQSATTEIEEFTFENLTAGTYYVEAVDYGGCTGRTASFIIQPSVDVDFGFYPVNDSQCGGPSGKIFVTGQTGVPPWTYRWSNEATGSTITGLTAGTYSVEVTDATGCKKIKSQQISQVDPVGLGSFVVDNIPTCLNSDGMITMTITGGTPPYYYSASTGAIEVSYSPSFSLIGIPAGAYNFSVTDAALCKFTTGTDLASPNGITDLIITTTPSACSNETGSILTTVLGGTAPYVYSLVYPDASTVTITTNSQSNTFVNLSGGVYTVIVGDESGCVFTEETTIFSDSKFTISTTTTGTTCGADNGIISVVKSTGGTAPFTYTLDDKESISNTVASAVTFTNVSSGQHEISVVDSSGCTETLQVIVSGSSLLTYGVYTTSSDLENQCSITTFISGGVPPFEFTWSDNVPENPQSITVTGLSRGDYEVTITDNAGCSQSRTARIDANRTYVSYQTYLMGEDNFTLVTGTKKGLLQMLNQGFQDLTASNQNCNLVSATFLGQMQIQPAGLVQTDTFFTTTSLTVAPSDNLWYDTVQNLVTSFAGITAVIDPLTSEITISIDPTLPQYSNQEVIIELIIVYDIMCLT